MDEVPSAYAVDARLGPTDGNSATVYLFESSAGVLPRAKLPDLFEHFDECLPEGSEISDHVPAKLRRKGALAKIVLVGLTPTEALKLVRRVKSWFFERLASDRVKRTEQRLRKQRQQAKAVVNRRSRYNGRKECRRYVGLAGS